MGSSLNRSSSSAQALQRPAGACRGPRRGLRRLSAPLQTDLGPRPGFGGSPAWVARL